jgi:hypothetical protein
MTKCLCDHESEWECSICEEPLCDNCDAGDFKDECSLCSSCKNSRDEASHDYYWENHKYEEELLKEKQSQEIKSLILQRKYNIETVKSIKDLYK